MKFFPVFLNLRQRKCLVVGGGEVAARKIRLLIDAEAQVVVVSPKLCDAVQKLAAANEITHINKPFSADDLTDAALVIAATDSSEVNQAVNEAAQQAGILVNVVDQPDLCNFIVPSLVDRSPVLVAISTGGAAPVLGRLLRARLETIIPSGYGRLASLVAGFREQVKQRFDSIDERRRFWERILQGPVAELLFSGREQQAAQSLVQALETAEEPAATTPGEVYLVGAGPGDPDLLTFRALRLIQQAEVVLYDRLVSKEILNLTRRDADKIYVGKQKSLHTLRQQEINELLVELAKQGKRVLRLKGGDPFIFGRGGEEIDSLSAENIPFQVIPGITAASGCAAYAGIPLTHRDYAQSCTFVTGHLQNGTTDLNWKSLAQPQQTVVIYMGLTGLDIICEKLVEHGMPPDMPAALVQQGTTLQQKVLSGTISTLPDIVQTTEVQPPTLVIIGNVVKLREKLAWFKADLMPESSTAQESAT